MSCFWYACEWSIFFLNACSLYVLCPHVLCFPPRIIKSGQYPPPYLTAWVSKRIPSPSLNEKKPPGLARPRSWGTRGSKRR